MAALASGIFRPHMGNDPPIDPSTEPGVDVCIEINMTTYIGIKARVLRSAPAAGERLGPASRLQLTIMRLLPCMLAALLAAGCGGASSNAGTGAIRCATDSDCGSGGLCVAGLCPSGAALTASSTTSSLAISTTAPAYGTSGLPLPAGPSSGNKSTILVTLKTAGGASVGAGQSVTLSSDGSNNSIWPSGGSVVSNNALGSTNGSGVAIFYMTSTTAETKNLTATINTAPTFTLSGTQLFTTAGPLSLANCSFVAAPVSPAQVAADGVATSTLTTTLKDAYGNLVAGHLVTYACTSGCTTVTYSPSAAGSTNALGVYSATITSTTVEDAAIKSTIQGLSALTLAPNYVQFVATAPAAPLLTANPTTVYADGVSVSTLTAKVTDQSGNPLAGQVITFNNSSVGTLSAATCVTAASGICAVTISSLHVLGTTNITATANSLTSAPVGVTFTASGVESQTLSSITVSPGSVPADSVTPLTVTITILDTTGQPMIGYAVTLYGNGANVSLNSVSGVTGSNGQFTATDVSNVGPQTVTFTSAATAWVTTATGAFTAATPTGPPAPPINLVATGGCSGPVSLSWSASQNATWYHLYRSTHSGGPYTLIDSPQWTSQVDSTAAAATNYYYVVTASNGLGASAYSAEVAVVCPPPAPTGLAVSGGCSGPATLTWNASLNATSYDVLFSLVSGGPYTYLAGTSSTSYIDAAIPAFTNVYYVVDAANANGTSAYSSAFEVNCNGVTCPAQHDYLLQGSLADSLGGISLAEDSPWGITSTGGVMVWL